MIETSDEYKIAVQAKTQKWTPSVTIDYSDYNIDNSIDAFNNDPDRLSDDRQMADGIESPTFEWWTWNNFRWGQHMRSESSTNNEKGSLSYRISALKARDRPVRARPVNPTITTKCKTR